MYGILMGALLLLPWSLAMYIAFGAYRATRRMTILSKRMK